MRHVMALTAMLAVTALASATVIINDDFESYPDDAALGAVWPLAVGTTADSYLDNTANGPTLPGVQSVRHTTVAARRDQNIADTQVTGTDHLIWAYDFYDDVGDASNPRQYGQLLSRDAALALNELVAMGMYNTVTMPGEVFDGTKYQARVAFAAGMGWFNLNTSRSVGWHRFEAHIYANQIKFYVDGVFDRGPFPHAGLNWYQARIGSGLSSAGGAAGYDNYLLDLVPEPGAALLLVLGGLLLRRR